MASRKDKLTRRLARRLIDLVVCEKILTLNRWVWEMSAVLTIQIYSLLKLVKFWMDEDKKKKWMNEIFNEYDRYSREICRKKSIL